MKKYSGTARFAFFLLAVTLTVYGIIVTRDLLYPITFGILLSYLLFPITNFMEKHKIPRILSILISIIIAISVFAGFFIFVSNQVESLIVDLPHLKNKALSNIRNIENTINNLLESTDFEIEDFFRPKVNDLFEHGGEMFNTVFSATTGTLVKIGLMPVYVFLFLYYRTKIALFILKIVPEKEKFNTITILKEISKVSARYMGGILMVVIILFFLNSTGLMIIGFEHAVTLGVISALFSFIPYFGTLLGGTVPLTYALLTGDFPSDPLKVIILYLSLNFLENNILTPNIVGTNVNISPFFIIIGLIASSMVWGIPGMLVIVPFLAIIRIIFSHIEHLKPYAYLLGTGGTQRYAITLNKIKRLIKR